MALWLQKACNLGKKIAHFSMGENVWQLSKYYDYDKNLAECSYCTSETTLASQLLGKELQKYLTMNECTPQTWVLFYE